jgi:hypothetical protein
LPHSHPSSNSSQPRFVRDSVCDMWTPMASVRDQTVSPSISPVQSDQPGRTAAAYSAPSSRGNETATVSLARIIADPRVRRRTRLPVESMPTVSYTFGAAPAPLSTTGLASVDSIDERHSVVNSPNRSSLIKPTPFAGPIQHGIPCVRRTPQSAKTIVQPVAPLLFSSQVVSRSLCL